LSSAAGARDGAARRAFLAALLAGLCSWPRRAPAEEAPVPISLQVELLLKVAAYDKNLTRRGASRVSLLVLVKQGDPDSGRSAAQARLALSKVTDILGLPLESSSAVHGDAAGLAQLLRANNVAILYLMPGFSESELAAIAEACSGISVLSVGALARHVERGTVLAFDLVGGKPKLLVNLTRAKRQQVELSSSVLKLMRVIE
jgi:hypothetical protein